MTDFATIIDDYYLPPLPPRFPAPFHIPLQSSLLFSVSLLVTSLLATQALVYVTGLGAVTTPFDPSCTPDETPFTSPSTASVAWTGYCVPPPGGTPLVRS